MTKRKSISKAKRARIFLKTDGHCYLCGDKIGADEKWDVEHKIALVNGGDDCEDNMVPAHNHCHKHKTRKDVAQYAHINRLEKERLGKPKRKRDLYKQKIPSRPGGIPKHVDPWGKKLKRRFEK